MGQALQSQREDLARPHGKGVGTHSLSVLSTSTFFCVPVWGFAMLSWRKENDVQTMSERSRTLRIYAPTHVSSCVLILRKARESPALQN